MKRLAWLVAIVACHGKDATPLPLDAKPPPAIDAAPPAIDAPPPRAKATATQLAVGAHHSCAVMSDATLRCWGANDHGQLGDGSQRDSPVAVAPLLHGVKQVTLGEAHACALLDDGSVACWGRIGFGKKKEPSVPTAVPGVVGVTRVFAFGGASCAIAAGGKVVCWGDIDPRGHVTQNGASRVPTPIYGLDHVVDVTANGVAREDGTIVLWSREAVKAQVTGELASAGDAACGLREDGKVACVGGSARCAPPVTKPKKPPTRKAKKPAPEPPKPATPVELLKLPKATHLAFGAGTCVVSTAGQLECLDPSDGCKSETWLAKVDAVAGDCARLGDGTVKCWEHGKQRSITAIRGVAKATAIAATDSRGCALLGDGAVTCWDRGAQVATPIAF